MESKHSQVKIRWLVAKLIKFGRKNKSVKAVGVWGSRLGTLHHFFHYIWPGEGPLFVPLQESWIPDAGLASDQHTVSHISMLPATAWSNVGPNQRTEALSGEVWGNSTFLLHLKMQPKLCHPNLTGWHPYPGSSAVSEGHPCVARNPLNRAPW